METTLYQTLVDIQIIYKKNEESIKKSAIHKKGYIYPIPKCIFGDFVEHRNDVFLHEKKKNSLLQCILMQQKKIQFI